MNLRRREWGISVIRPAPAPGASPGDEGRPLDAGMREATPASQHVLGQVGQPYGWKWWPGTELNRRRQPFQSVAILHDQQLAGCGRLRKSF
jgi:hypothetical protein